MVEKIDAHGHFFKSYLGPESSIDEYLRHAKGLGVVLTVASPGPTPEYKQDGVLYRPSVWRRVNGIIQYDQQHLDDESRLLDSRPSNQNPYADSNRRLIDVASGLNQNSSLKIKVMPIHHPVLDTSDEILGFIYDPNVIAIKLHGIATFTGPSDVTPEVTKALSQTRKPMIVHTDLYNGDSKTDLAKACNMNHPSLWVDWAIANNVRLLITHGARLSEDAIAKINSHPELFIDGISPDLLIMSEPGHLEKQTDNFIRDLLTKVNRSQLVFDIDYGWNVYGRGQWDKNDWDMCQRFESTAQLLGLSDKEIEDIYYNNAAKFYF